MMESYRPDYWLLSLVQVDRGMIPTVAKRMNGEPIYGQHLPYYTGLVIQEVKTGKQCFLDEFNSEILLTDYLELSRYSIRLPLRLIVQTDEFRSIRDRLNLISVKDLDEYLKLNRLTKKHRNAEAMHKIAKSISTCDFN